jgi:ASPM-SPD-2-Hydin domain-containing protein/centrosomal CEP192-like protein/beta-propeller repeat-containing protein
MKTRGSWVRVAKMVGIAGLACGLLVAATFRITGKRTEAGQLQVASRHASKISAPEIEAKWSEAYGKLPLSFEENQGQTAREVRYVSHGSGYELFLTPQEAVLALRPKVRYDLSPLHRSATLRALREARRAGQLTAIRLGIEGANPNAKIEGIDQLPGKSNYFVGNDPKKWHTDVPSFAHVKYNGIYPGVDLVFYGNQQRLEYDFVVAPGADPNVIAMKVDGARKMRIDSRGDLVLNVAGGEVELEKPVVYQNVKGGRREIGGKYVLAGNHRVTFAVDSYNRKEPLVLDPTLNYSTYLGGGGGALISDAGSAIAVDASGNAYIAGQTFSTSFPSGAKGDGIASPVTNSGASFVAELNAAGTQLLYSAYLIGTTTSSSDSAFGIALDPSGKVYVTGSTLALDFPTTAANALNAGPLIANANGTAYLTKLDPTVNGSSSLLYSTYLAGTGGDFANSVAADATGNAYVVGQTFSSGYPTQNAFQSTPSNASGTAFLTRIDTTQSKASSLIYSTYLGGNGSNAAALTYGDQAFGVAVDSAHVAYLVGSTSSTDSAFITTATAYQTAPPALNTQGSVFVSKIDTTLTGAASLIYSTYLAGSVQDLGNAIALAPSKVAYITGTTSSTDFPSPGATAGAFSSTGSAFVTLVDTTKSGSNSVPYSTYLGGSQPNTGFGIRVDAAGIAYVVGTASSNDLGGAGTFKKLGSFQPTLSNTNGTPFFAKLNPGGAGSADLLYATFFGGSGNPPTNNSDQGFGIAIDSATPPNAYLTGQTFSADMPVLTPLPTGGSLIPPSAAFVAKLSPIPTVTVSPSPFAFGVQPVGATSSQQTFTLTNNNSTTVTFTSIVAVGVSPAANTDFAVASDACSPSVAAGAQCTVTVTFTPAAAGARTGTLVFTDNDVNSPQNVSLSGTGSATAPGVGLAPTSLAFGNQTLNTTSAAKTVTLANTGTGALTINSIAASGDFAETSTGATACPISPATLAAGASCIISVTFTPTALGARAGTLTITDNAGGSPQIVPLTGTGTGTPDFGLTGPTTVQPVTLGQTLNFSVTVTGTGGFNSPVALACTGAPALSQCTVTSPVTPPVAPPSTIQAQVSMTTTAFVVPPLGMPTPIAPPRQVVPLVLALMLLLSLVWVRRPRLRLAMATAVLTLIAITGCNGIKHQSTPKGPATLTITGTSGALTHNVQVQISVN